MARHLSSLTSAPADHRIHYAAGEFQFGDLRVPTRAVSAPVVVFVHGGWWKAQYGLDYAVPLCEALKSEGIATWSLEYRRIGNPGGGWPGTFEDVATGYDHLTALAKTYPLDLTRIIAMGHSAGGHLAFWLAGRPHLPQNGILKSPASMLPLHGVVSLAGVVDLRMTLDLAGHFTFSHAREQVTRFMGGTPTQVPDRYAAGNPGDLLPLNIPQILVQGTYDDQIPPQLPLRWATRAKQLGETATVIPIAGADHQDVVNPNSPVWPQLRDALSKLLR